MRTVRVREIVDDLKDSGIRFGAYEIAASTIGFVSVVGMLDSTGVRPTTLVSYIPVVGMAISCLIIGGLALIYWKELLGGYILIALFLSVVGWFLQGVQRVIGTEVIPIPDWTTYVTPGVLADVVALILGVTTIGLVSLLFVLPIEKYLEMYDDTRLNIPSMWHIPANLALILLLGWIVISGRMTRTELLVLSLLVGSLAVRAGRYVTVHVNDSRWIPAIKWTLGCSASVGLLTWGSLLYDMELEQQLRPTLGAARAFTEGITPIVLGSEAFGVMALTPGVAVSLAAIVVHLPLSESLQDLSSLPGTTSTSGSKPSTGPSSGSSSVSNSATQNSPPPSQSGTTDVYGGSSNYSSGIDVFDSAGGSSGETTVFTPQNEDDQESSASGNELDE